MAIPDRSRSPLDSPSRNPDGCGHEHQVEFYETDAFLVDTVLGFIGPALEDGDAAIVVATPPHRSAIEDALRTSGIDVAGAVANDRYLAFDAADLLETLTAGGALDAGCFADTVGGLIERAGAGSRRVRIYGEMVALLLDAGDGAAAVALEDLWNELAQTHAYALLCAYPMRSFKHPSSAAAFGRICTQHSTVIPSEGYSLLHGADEQQRAVALLQQENAALRAGATVAPPVDVAEAAYADALTGIASFGFGLIDLDLRFVRVNLAFAAMHGVAVEDQRGRPASDVIAELWAQLEPALEAMLVSGDGVHTREFVGTRPSAPVRVGTWLYTFYPVHGGGDLVGIGCFVLDVTEQRHAERLRAVIMQTIAEGLLVLDGDGRLTCMNVAAEQMLGWTEDELRGGHVQDLIHRRRSEGDPLPSSGSPLAGVFGDRRPLRSCEDFLVRRDGRLLPVVCSATPEPSGGVVIAFSDATPEIEERERAERKLDAVTWVGRLREALDEDRLELYSQPIVALGAGTAREELLLRMITPEGEVVPAGAFIPAADELGLVVEIDRWVIAQAVRCAAIGRIVQVNVSAASVADDSLLEFVERELRRVGAPAANVIFEVAEAALMSDAAAGETFAAGLRKLGCGLALDDFGAASGSFAYLERLPVALLKIPLDFVRDLPSNAANQHLVQAIVALARRFGNETVAGGVEDKQTLALLRDYGVDYAQGYDMGQPAPMAASRIAVAMPVPAPAGNGRSSRPADDRARLLRGRLLDDRESQRPAAAPAGLVWTGPARASGAAR